MSPFAEFISSFFEKNGYDSRFLIVAVLVHSVVLLMFPAIILAYADRKIRADIQMRVGPNRVGPFGIFQNLSDAIKNIFKADNVPKDARENIFKNGIILALVCTFIAFGPIPFAESWTLSRIEWSSIVVILMMTLTQLIVFFATYSSASHWSIVGSFRILMLMTFYLVPVILGLLPAVLIAGSANFSDIVNMQDGAPWKWLIFNHPPVMFSFIASFVGLSIWQAISPFDLLSPETDLGGGILTEYSGLRRYFAGLLKYLQLLLACSYLVTVFLGGWKFPINLEAIGRAANIFECIFFFSKVFILALFSIWIQWSLPRMQITQIVALSWKVLVPAALVGCLGTAVWLVLMRGAGIFGGLPL